MPQPINFGNVRLTLQQFNEIASGKYNAGEVRLDGERALTKINNHVFFTRLNTVSLSHAEVLAIKDAFVKALSQSGVKQEEINRIRQELGLAPRGAVDLQLNQRSVRPLTRQQIRDILDRNADDINAKQGAGTIRTDEQIHAEYDVGYRMELAQTRMKTNAALKDQRATEDDPVLKRVQTVIAGDVDFQPRSDREWLLREAQHQKDVILDRSNGVPSRAPGASFHYVREYDGLDVELKLGMSELQYVNKLDALIMRLSSIPAPSEAVLLARREFSALHTFQAFDAWMDAQAGAPDGAFKVRTAVVTLLHARGVQDYDTLSLVNRLSEQDARSLLRALFNLATNRRGDELRQVVAAYAKPPFADVPAAAQTYVPVLSREAYQAAVQQADQELIAAGRETTARFAPNGAATRSALDMGYYPSEITMLRRTAELYQGATGCSADKAVEVALDPTSGARRLFSYGGRFTASTANFRAGLRLLNDFKTWFAETNAQINVRHDMNGRVPVGANATVVNASLEHFTPTAARAYERFLFEEIAGNDAIPLEANDPNQVFGMEVNPATRFVGRGYARSAASTLAQIPPDRRRTLYAVADLLSPLEQTVAAAKENSFSSLNFELISRVMRHYDEVAVMQASGQLNRANFLTRIFTEVPRAASKTNSQIETALSSRIYEEMEANQLPDNPYSLFQIGLLMQNSGATAPEAAELVAAGRTMPPAPYISDGCGNLSELDGTPRGGRATMLADFCRPLGPEFVSGNRAALAPENIVYKVVFPDGRVLRSVFGGARDPHVMSANAAIADLVAAFCGNVHPKQLSAVYYALSQVGTGVLRGGLVQHGIFSTEHMPVTFTLEKNDTTGVITIRYSEPEGLPVHFHWETTIALDGTATSTPMVVTH